MRAPHAVALHRSWKRRVPVLFVALALFGSVVLHRDQPLAVHAIQAHSVVQAAGARVQAVSNSSTGAANVVVTFAAATAGNLLVGCACVSEVLGAVDKDINTPAGWSAISLADINNTTKVRGRTFFKVAAGGETSVTFAQASGTTDMAAYVMEFSGTATTSPEDQAAENSGSTSPSATGTMSAPVAGAIAVGFVAIVNTNNLTTPAGGYTLEGTVVSGNATPANAVKLAMLYDVSSPSTASGVTQGGAARPFVAQIVSFKPAAAADVTITPAVATATAAGSAPVVSASLLPAAATATAAGVLPTPTTKLLPAISTATAAGIVPTVSASLSPAVAAAAAAGQLPVISVSMVPAVAGATGAAFAPTLSIGVTIQPGVAVATAQSFVPLLTVSVAPGVASATAVAFVPVVAWGFSYFLPPTELYLHSKDRFEFTTDELGKTHRGHSSAGRYRGLNRNLRAVQRQTDPEGYFSVGAFMFRGGYWNGPLSDAEIAAITAAGLDDRIRQAREPGLLPPGVD